MSKVISLIRIYVFFLLFFAVGRLLFLLYNISSINELGWVEALKAFVYAVPLDTSAACYFLVIPFLLSIAYEITPLRFYTVFFKYFVIVLLFPLTIIYASELLMYDEWGTKLNYKAIAHLVNPLEVFKTATVIQYVKFWSALLLFYAASVYVFVKFVYKPLEQTSFNGVKKVFFIFCFLAFGALVLVLGIRGGVKPIAINQSSAYFSKHPIFNDAAVNSSWNLIHSITENAHYLNENPYLYLPQARAKQIVDSLYEVKVDTTVNFLTVKKPNVVLLILESWSSDLIQTLSGDKGITPRVDSLIKQGLLFSNIYAAGHSSDMGMHSILSAFPGQPSTSVITQPSKYQHLPCIVSGLKKEGYHSSYYFGGQLSYGNIKSYVYFSGFDRILEEGDFKNPDFVHGRLGVHDAYTLQQQLSDLDQEQQPFFSTLFTLSTHPPFDMPMKPVINFGGEERMYLNSAFYTDSCLGDYFTKAKSRAWYKNTLFVIVADHSHDTHKQWPYYSPMHYSIPLIFLGDVVKPEFKGKRIEKLGSQVDLVKTLYKQLGIDASAFHWSKDLMNPYTKEFAYYPFYDGLAWVKPEGAFAYQTSYKAYYYNTAKDTASFNKLVNEGRSYLQVMFQEYLDF